MRACHLLLLSTAVLALSGPPAEAREVAVTIDDLPFVGPTPVDGRSVAENMRRLVKRARAAGVRPVGFAVGRRKRNTNALAIWRDAGFPLANHTYHHRKYSETAIDAYLADVKRNEDALRERLGVELRGGFFRFPYLDHGHTEAKVAAMAAYLVEHGYRLAPVSLDTVDYAFNAWYAKQPEGAKRRRIVRYYRQHIEQSAAHFEALSERLFGREIPLILLLHANPLNADHLDDVLELLRQRGYRFITLDKALADPAYRAYGARPPHVPLAGDRNFLNQVALSRGIRIADPSGDGHFRKHWRPKLEALAK